MVDEMSLKFARSQPCVRGKAGVDGDIVRFGKRMQRFASLRDLEMSLIAEFFRAYNPEGFVVWLNATPIQRFKSHDRPDVQGVFSE
jgi:hypothetical protein